MVEIRRAEPNDAEAIRTVARVSWHAAYDDLLGRATVDRTVDEWYALDSLRAVIDDPEHVVSVAEDGDTAVLGFAHVGPTLEDDGLAELYRIYVRPGRWGEGIGSRLLGDVTERVAGYDRLGLSVFAENEVGIGFYEREGSSGSRYGRSSSREGATMRSATRERSSRSESAARACT